MTTSPPAPTSPTAPVRSVAFSALTGLTGLAVLLQGVWAGIFLGDGPAGWTDVHAVGGAVSVLLAVLVIAEYGAGMLIADDGRRGLMAVHVPLAMAVLGLLVWLPVRSRHGGRRVDA